MTLAEIPNSPCQDKKSLGYLELNLPRKWDLGPSRTKFLQSRISRYRFQKCRNWQSHICTFFQVSGTYLHNKNKHRVIVTSEKIYEYINAFPFFDWNRGGGGGGILTCFGHKGKCILLRICNLLRTSHTFNENQPMHRNRNFLKVKFNENS